MIYVTSDTHFFHKNVIKYDNRPFENVNQMNETIINNWNSVVGENDLVLHLGDFAFAGAQLTEETLNRLNGYKILIRGNHDRFKSHKYRSMGFVDCVDSIIIDGIILSHYPIYKNNPSEWVNTDKRKKSRMKYKQYVDKVALNDLKYIIHGHIHCNPIQYDNRFKQYNVSCCVHNYIPIRFDLIKEILK